MGLPVPATAIMPATASPGTLGSLHRFRTDVLRAWRYVPSRRSNCSRTHWSRFKALLLRFPHVPARIVHVRRHPRITPGRPPEEPDAGEPHVRIREGALGDRRLYSTKSVRPRARPGEPRYGARRQQESKAPSVIHPNRSTMPGGAFSPTSASPKLSGQDRITPKIKSPGLHAISGPGQRRGVRSGRPFLHPGAGRSRMRPCSRAALVRVVGVLLRGPPHEQAHAGRLPLRRAGPLDEALVSPRAPAAAARRYSARRRSHPTCAAARRL